MNNYLKTCLLCLLLMSWAIPTKAAVYVQNLDGLTGSYVVDSYTSTIEKYQDFDLGEPIVPVVGFKYELEAHVTFPKFIDDEGKIFDMKIGGGWAVWSTSPPPVFFYNTGDSYTFTSYHNFMANSIAFYNYTIDINNNINYLFIKNDIYGTDWTNGVPNGAGGASEGYKIELPNLGNNYYGLGAQFWTGDLTLYEPGLVEVTSVTISFNTDSYFFPDIPEPKTSTLIVVSVALLLAFKRRCLGL